MPRKPEAYVEEIISAIKDIESFTQGMTYETYAEDAKTKAAVERNLLLIGEALNQLSQLQPKIKVKITDLEKIVAFRNILVHGYFGIDDALVWDVLENKLKVLKKEISEV